MNIFQLEPSGTLLPDDYDTETSFTDLSVYAILSV